MNEREFGGAVRRYLDGFGAYDGRPVLSALAEPIPGRWGRSLLASAGMVLTVALVVGVLLLPRWAAEIRGASAPGTRPPAAAGPPSAAGPPAQPPSLLVSDPVSQGLTRMDWSGRKLGSIAPSVTGILSLPAPDGALILVYGTGGDLSFVSGTSGETVGRASLPGNSLGVMPIWADDSRHVCDTRQTPSGTVVAVLAIDSAAGRIEQRTIPVQGLPVGQPPIVDACSTRTNRIVLSVFTATRPTMIAGTVRVLRLTDGMPLFHWDYPAPAPFANIRVSPDALYLAGSPPGGTRPARTTVVDLSTGDEIAHVEGVGEQFSADDRYLAVSSFTSEVSVGGGTGSLVEWSTGRTVWRGEGQLAILAYQPDGQAVAVQLYSLDAEPPNHDRFLIVRPDGGAITIKQNGVLTPTR
jgi:hypothetical protein